MNGRENSDASAGVQGAGAMEEPPIRLFPLRPFLESLAGDVSLAPGARDYRRLCLALRCEARWDLQQVRRVVVSILARGDEDATRLERRFDRFFESDSAGEVAPGFKREPDLAKALSDLKAFSDRYRPIARRPAAMEPPLPPPPKTMGDSGKSSPRRAERQTAAGRPGESGCDFSLTELGAPPVKRGAIELPPLDFKKPTVFSAARLGGPPEPILRPQTLDELADSMGYFRSPIAGRNLDIEATVDGTIRRGVPELVFHRRQQICSLLILIDRRAEDFQWNGVPLELAAGMESRGVPVRVGWFEGLPEVCHDESGRRWRLEDLEGSRRGLFVLLFTDGRSFHSENARFALERLANWPRLAWLDPRETRFHDASSALAAIHRIPVHAAGNEGLLRVARDFLGERGAAPPGKGSAVPAPSILDRGGLPLGARIAGILGDALPLAEELSVLPVGAPASRGLIGSLRRERHPHVAPEAVGRLCALPGSQAGAQGVRLGEPVRRWLRNSLETRAGDDLKLKNSLADFFLGQLEGIQPLKDAVAHFAWRAWRQWILLALVPNRADAGELRVLLADNSPAAGLFDSSARSESLRVPVSELDPAQAAQLRAAGLEFDSSATPPGMVPIPAGPFKMGDPFGCGDSDELPVHVVEVSEFFMGRDPVTLGLWREVYDWAVKNGYIFANRGGGAGDNHPVHSIDWHDAVKWCNAASEKEGLAPVYFTAANRQVVYREGGLDLTAECADWEADGYRLPTEAEWEKAARGGLEGQQYPWPSPDKDFDKQITPKRATYGKSSSAQMTPIGTHEPNGFGLRDMAGNVREWCWDWDDSNWYRKADASKKDTRGPETGGGEGRAVRGGGWYDSARILRCAYRYWYHPQLADVGLGFRLARGQTVARSGAGSGKGARDERPARARVRFAPPGGRIEPEIVPADARLSLREAFGARETPANKAFELAPGRWHLRARAKGFFEGRASFEIAAGTRYGMKLRLHREPPKGFQYIPPGPFLMGDHSDAGEERERPRHEVDVSGFYLDRHPVTLELWRRVHAWAVRHGYEFANKGAGKGEGHPAQTVSWHDAVKWCNAGSEMEGLPPAYFLDDARTEVFRKGERDIASSRVRWRGEGYRLPTEAEWEKAARGGLEGHHFPWPSAAGDYEKAIDKTNANYGLEKGETTPAGAYAANGFGLYDMAGNVDEWVWDKWDENWYGNAASHEADCTGPESGGFRAVRGGGWYVPARNLRCAFRYWYHPLLASDFLGFRLARGQAVERSEAGAGKEARDERPAGDGSRGAPARQRKQRQ